MAIVFAVFAQPAFADGSTASLDVCATVVPPCTVDASTISFGTLQDGI